MGWDTLMVWGSILLLMVWIAYELGWGGGDPAHKDRSGPRNGPF